MAGNRPVRHTDRDRKKDLEKIGIAAAALAVVGSAAWFGISRWEDSRYETEGGESSVYVEPVILEARTVEVDGVTYVQKQNIETYLLMGIDDLGIAEKEEGDYGNGQSDVMMVLVLDNSEDTWRLLQLNRDTMYNVPVINDWGDITGVQFEQICLAHAYGKDLNAGCQNATQMVSGMLWNQPINGYVSMNMGAVPSLNDALGGVPVVMQEDYTSLDPAFVKGAEVNLMGEQSLKFVRTRKTVDDGTNLARMARQRQYMSSFLKKFMSLNEEQILDVTEGIEEYVVSDMKTGVIAGIGNKARQYTQLDLMTIDGELRDGTLHDWWEFYMDEKSLEQTILELFYTRQEG